VFCGTRIDCEDIGALLISEGIDVCIYHAGMNTADRKRVIEDWTSGNGPRICIATVCFGMGIDRSDVDFVVHYSLPMNLSAYHQVRLFSYGKESGRAGRDGRKAECVLFYNESDRDRGAFLIGQKEGKVGEFNRKEYEKV
jgi:superfamily II DNA helicase RecQ